MGQNVARILRDRLRRLAVAHYEVERNAFKIILKDKTLPLAVRIRAQLEIQKLPGYSIPGAVWRRCVVSGKARVRGRIFLKQGKRSQAGLVKWRE